MGSVILVAGHNVTRWFAICRCSEADASADALDCPLNARKSDDAQFCDDVISIITVFSAKLYGARSHRNRRAARSPTQLCST
jgi:predicted site-specific integrase-resolvase